MGLGQAFVIPFYNTLSIFAGALIAWVLAKGTNELADTYTLPVASGVVAGERLTGIAVSFLGTSRAAFLKHLP